MNDPTADAKPANRYHHGDLRATLVRAGLKAIREGGVENLSLRAVAAIAGVSRTAPYAHFADKGALIGAIRDEVHSRFGDLMRQQCEGSGYQPLYNIARAYVNFACEEPALFKLITAADAPIQKPSATGAPVYADGLAVMFAAVAKAVGGGVLTPRAMTVALGGLTMARGIAQLLLDGHLKPEMLGLKDRDQMVNLLIGLLEPPETPTG